MQIGYIGFSLYVNLTGNKLKGSEFNPSYCTQNLVPFTKGRLSYSEYHGSYSRAFTEPHLTSLSLQCVSIIKKCTEHRSLSSLLKTPQIFLHSVSDCSLYLPVLFSARAWHILPRQSHVKNRSVQQSINVYFWKLPSSNSIVNKMILNLLSIL